MIAITKRCPKWRLSAMLFVLCSSSAFAQPLIDEDFRTEKVVMLLREGVGSGAWIDGVEQDDGPTLRASTRIGGSLSAHGWAALIQWGGYYREYLATLGLLPSRGDVNTQQVTTFASPSQRSRESADAFLEGLLPGAHVPPLFTETHAFRPAMDGLTPSHPDSVRQAVIAGLGMPLEAAQERYQGEMRAVENQLELPTGRLSHLPWQIQIDEGGVRIAPLQLLDHMVESVRTRYVGNQQMHEFDGDGPPARDRLAQLLALRQVNFDATRHPRHLAVRHAAPLLRRLSEAIRWSADERHPQRPSVSIYVGHDTNIASIRSVLGFDWETPDGLINDVVPGGMLMFEQLQHVPSAQRFVRISYHAPTMDQLRTLQRFNESMPPFSAFFEPDRPDANLIPLSRFTAFVQTVTDEAQASSATNSPQMTPQMPPQITRTMSDRSTRALMRDPVRASLSLRESMNYFVSPFGQ